MAAASQPTAERRTIQTASFVAGIGECEEKTVVLKIENVAEFLDLSNEELVENGLTFNAGNYTLKDRTSARATWKYYLKHTKENGVDWVGGQLNLHIDPDYRSMVKSAKALHSVSFSSGGIPITSYSMPGCEEFDGSYDWGQDKLITKSELLQKTQETNSLEVTLLVKVFSNRGFKPVLQEASLDANSIVMCGEIEVTSDLLKMLDSGDLADVEIKVPKEVGGKVDESSYTKKAHKIILMARSSVFAKMFAEESKMVEAKTGKVVISDLSPKGLDIFLNYIYTGEVLADWAQVLPELLNAAEKYDCGKLKDFCAHNFMAAVTAGNAIKMLKLAKLHKICFAAMGVKEFIQKNAVAVFTEDVIDNVADDFETE